jgi:Ca2+-binding RTX toxin-like protein
MTDSLSRRWTTNRTAARRRLLVRGLEGLEDRTTPNVAYAVDAAGTNILTFDTSTPDTATTKAITGLTGNELIVALDLRPFDGQLYAIGRDPVATSSHLYRLDAGTGAATQVGPTPFNNIGAGVGMDFNPVVDRIRVVTNAGENFRLNPNDGTFVQADTAINPAAPGLHSIAYDRSLNFRPDAATAPPAGTLTTLFGIDLITDKLVRIGGVDGTPSPNGGEVTQLGDLGTKFGITAGGFDIPDESTSGFAVLTPEGDLKTALYKIDLATGTATKVGATATNLGSLVVLPDTVTGTDGDDLIELAPNPTLPQSMLVTINSVPKGAFGNPTAGVNTLVNAGKGNDTIRSADGLLLGGVRLDGGEGTDTLDYSLWTTGVGVNLSDAAQGDFVFRTTLTGTAEVPPVDTTAKGTATVVLNSVAKTFDLRMDVTGIDLAELTGSHFHEGAVGVDGPIFIDLGDGSKWTTTAAGIARAITDGEFPDTKIASALTGQTYLNVHTTAFPGGEIRGQLTLTAGVNSATGFATGQVIGFENAIGGSGDDTLVGNNLDNLFQGGAGADVLLGRGGKDRLVGNKGADQMFGDAGDDTTVWNNGDGSDLMEGGAGTDTVEVNGGTADEVFTIAPNGDRLAFARVSPGPFKLDIGTAELLDLNTFAGKVTVTAAPSQTVAYNLAGGDPDTLPGDRLIVNVSGVTGSTVTTPSGSDQGQYTFPGGFQPITFNGFESFSPVPTPFAAGPDAGVGTTVRVYDAAGKNPTDFAPLDPTATGGVRVAMADFNGDGVLDLVAGTGPGVPTRVRVLDGKTKAELFTIDPFEATFKGGVFVAAGDLTGDGIPDVIISPDRGGGPRVRIFSGADFKQVNDFFGIEDPNFRGGARAAVGDVTGDGQGDLVVAAGFSGGPRVAVFDGKSVSTGAANPTKPFGDFFVFENTLRNGVFIAAGDLNGDGFAEVIAGGGPGGGPRVFALSGEDLTAKVTTPEQLANFFSGPTTNRGGIHLAVKDLDGDARADLVTGDGPGAGTRIRAYFGSAIPANAPPPEAFALDAFPGQTGGVFVG